MERQESKEYAEVWATLRETGALLKELSEQSKENKREIAELAAQGKETRRTLDKLAVQSEENKRSIAELAEQGKETRRALDKLAVQSEENKRSIAKLSEESRLLVVQSKETRRALDELAAQSKETARYMRESNRRLEGLGLVQGEIAEELFYRTIKEAMAKQGIIIDEVLFSLEVKGIGEYDIVAVNRTSAFVFEIKNKLKMDHLEKLHKVQLPRFREAFPEYKNHKLYAGVGALVVKEHIETRARKLGFYVLTQGGKDNTVLHKPSSPLIF